MMTKNTNVVHREFPTCHCERSEAISLPSPVTMRSPRPDCIGTRDDILGFREFLYLVCLGFSKQAALVM
jgi:hypothetical protein